MGCFLLLFHLSHAALFLRNWTQNDKTYLTLSFSSMGHRGSTVRDESSVMCLSRCSNITVTFCSLTIQTPYSDSLLAPFFHLVSPRPPQPHLPLSSLFPLVILCTYKNADGAFGSRSNWIGCASVLARVSATERRLICGITSAALNCIEQLTDLFYDRSMRYLTYQCYKAWGPTKSVMFFFFPNSVFFSFNLLKSFI